MKRHKSGLLLHITSLPSPFGIGDLGPDAYEFADILKRSHQSFWQILPLNPTLPGPGFGNSPYSSPSAFAGNPLLISPALLVTDGLLDKSDALKPSIAPGNRVDYLKVIDYKENLFTQVVDRFQRTKKKDKQYEKFCTRNSNWLEDYALFESCREEFKGMAWDRWPEGIRNRKKKVIASFQGRLNQSIERHKILQYIFFCQWRKLRRYCNKKGIRIIGDLPLYVNYYSADVWAHPELFKLDKQKHPVSVGGVPPDYFSSTGQLWGNPLYDWKALRSTGYGWWKERIARNLELFELIRLDHFRGFAGYWAVPAGEKTAVNGKWEPGPGDDFFFSLKDRFKRLPFIAEDLGLITEDVIALRERFKFPGMRVVQFGFDSSKAFDKHHLPETYPLHCIAYTGTHDNNTIMGWFREQPESRREEILKYVHKTGVRGKEHHWKFIRLLMRSRSRTVICPLQDILGLGEEGRMNTPAVTDGNWEWRLLRGQFTAGHVKKLRETMRRCGRC